MPPKKSIPAPKVRPDTVVISKVTPTVEDGRYPAKRVVGERLRVEADIFKDGHDQLAAVLKFRRNGSRQAWQETPMTPLENDRWGAEVVCGKEGLFKYTIEAWSDDFLTWIHDFERRLTGDQASFQTEIEEGRVILNDAAVRAAAVGERKDAETIDGLAGNLMNTEPADVPALLGNADVIALMARWPDRSLSTEYRQKLPVDVERPLARFSAWYEFFPRNAEGRDDKHSTFRDCLPRIEDARDMGFDIVYFPPIHPIGITFRKGKNNTLDATPEDTGSPWAIGGPTGGHRAVEPQLGTIADFKWLVKKARKLGVEIALDFAINCSPDHPWVEDHPEWFFHRPDGTIKYAENPPKKYQDIYPINFLCDDWKELWEELLGSVRFWADMGVRVFRVDNPHTKPVTFWEWLIAAIRKTHPETIFLSEAFTRPRMMQVLGKAGFTQSYTYFTWRVTKQELIEYVTELTRGEMRDYYRANFWPNTPDILPYHLQHAPPAAFKIRAALAATLSTSWGIYSGYELCENEPLPGREEYLDSEKYQLKKRDWNQPGNIKAFIGRLNQIRRDCPALQEYANIEFIHCENDRILAFYKWTDDFSNIVIVTVNLDPEQPHETTLHLPLDTLRLPHDETFAVEDLMYDEIYHWKGSEAFISLDPRSRPVHLLQVQR